jgi:hypothetical protein
LWTCRGLRSVVRRHRHVLPPGSTRRRERDTCTSDILPSCTPSRRAHHPREIAPAVRRYLSRGFLWFCFFLLLLLGGNRGGGGGGACLFSHPGRPLWLCPASICLHHGFAALTWWACTRSCFALPCFAVSVCVCHSSRVVFFVVC